MVVFHPRFYKKSFFSSVFTAPLPLPFLLWRLFLFKIRHLPLILGYPSFFLFFFSWWSDLHLPPPFSARGRAQEETPLLAAGSPATPAPACFGLPTAGWCGALLVPGAFTNALRFSPCARFHTSSRVTPNFIKKIKYISYVRQDQIYTHMIDIE